ACVLLSVLEVPMLVERSGSLYHEYELAPEGAVSVIPPVVLPAQFTVEGTLIDEGVGIVPDATVGVYVVETGIISPSFRSYLAVSVGDPLLQLKKNNEVDLF